MWETQPPDPRRHNSYLLQGWGLGALSPPGWILLFIMLTAGPSIITYPPPPHTHTHKQTVIRALINLSSPLPRPVLQADTRRRHKALVQLHKLQDLAFGMEMFPTNLYLDLFGTNCLLKTRFILIVFLGAQYDYIVITRISNLNMFENHFLVAICRPHQMMRPIYKCC